MTSSVCFSCKRFFNQHSNDELSKCANEIIEGMKET